MNLVLRMVAQNMLSEAMGITRREAEAKMQAMAECVVTATDEELEEVAVTIR